MTSDSATLPIQCLYTAVCRKMFHNWLGVEGGNLDFVSFADVNTAAMADFKLPM